MSEARVQTGGCHCKKVRYEVKVAADSAIACNCSMCTKKGTLLTFADEASFTLHSGEDNLTDYLFNKQVIHHLFCKTCGVTSFARGKMPDGTPMVAINVRCLDDVDPEKLTIKHVDGRSRM
ncbi:MAG: Gfa-like protein [Labilithrix sp.]|nr:Gfa-like protein [Labilithrix sp.]